MDVGDVENFRRHFREQQQKAIKENKSEGELNKYKILNIILDHEPGGLTTSDLESLTGLHRDTIHQRCKDLIKDGLILKTNKAGKYHLSQKAYENPTLRSWYFKRKTMEKIMDWGLTTENSFCHLYNDNPEKYDHDGLSLFILSNRIGAFITYAMIQAVRPNEWVPLIRRRKRLTFRGRNRDKFAIEWIKNVIDPLKLFYLFSDCPPVKRGRAIYSPPRILSYEAMKGHFSANIRTEEQKKRVYESYLRQRERKYREFKPKNKKWSLYELDETSFDNLVRSYSRVFPNLFEKMEQIRNGLDVDIQDELAWRKETAT